jgi:hypothetical protein
MGDRRPKRQAVVVIHGIGEQRPMETLRSFVDAIVTKPNPTGQNYWNRPDRMSDSFELRKLIAPGDGEKWPTTDYYEYYWAANMRDTTWSDVLSWLGHLLLTPGKNIPPRMRWVWWWSRVLLVFALVMAIAAGVVSSTVGADLLARFSWLVSAVSVVAAAVLNVVFIKFIGDAARYLSPKPGNIAQRQAIRRDGVALVRRLHESGRYDRIIVVGHSLGSVIAYDILRFVWDEFRNVSAASDSPEREACLAQMRGMLEEGVAADPADTAAYAVAQDAFAKRFHALERQLWRAERENGGAWLVTDLVTCGSPLAHAAILLADSPEDLARRQRERELPTCPPIAQCDEDAFVYGHTLTDDEGLPIGTVPVLHTSATFACVRWTNLYFDADFIGGPVAPIFGPGVRDVMIRPEQSPGARRTSGFTKGYTPWSHSMYWAVPPQTGKTAPLHWDAIPRIREAMAVDDIRVMTFAEQPPPEEPGTDD